MAEKPMKKILAMIVTAALACAALPVYATEMTEEVPADEADIGEVTPDDVTEESDVTGEEAAESVTAAQAEEPADEAADQATDKAAEEPAEEPADTDSGTRSPQSYSYSPVNVPNTSLSFSASDGVPATTIRSELESLITSHEGNSTSINKNDNGTVSIGRLQFRGGLALELMRLVVAADSNTAYSILGDALYSEITNPSTSWAARPVNDAEAAALSSLLGTPTALAVQDNYVNSLLSMYLNQAYREGFRNVCALLYYGDICNHLGMNYGTLFGQYAINVAGSADAVTANEFHIATICCIYDLKPTDEERYNVEYIPLKRIVYGRIVDTANAHGWAYCQSGDSTIPYNADGTNGTRWLKNALNTYMNAGLTIDDTYDAATTEAVRSFQESEGLPQNGLADEKTSSLLIYRIYDNPATTGEVVSVLLPTIEKIDGVWTYTVGGVPDYTYTGLAKNENGWFYVKDGVVGFDYTGFAENSSGKWYVEDSRVTFRANNILMDGTGAVGTKGTWYDVAGSKVQTSFTGLANYHSENGWWYMDAGEINFLCSCVDKDSMDGFYVKDGEVQFDFAGLADCKNVYGWWYSKDGQADFMSDTAGKDRDAWWYVTDGKVDFPYSGVANYRDKNGWWYIRDGKADFTHNGVEKNQNGWWYVKDGKVDFSYNGIAQNSDGWWYIQNGKVDFNYTGEAEEAGKTCVVESGKVTGYAAPAAVGLGSESMGELIGISNGSLSVPGFAVWRVFPEQEKKA